MQNTIEETRQYLKEKFGEPYDKVVNGYRMRFENIQLNNFNRLLKELKRAIQKFEIQTYEEAIIVVCDYVKTDDGQNLDKIATRLKNLLDRRGNGNVKCDRETFVKFFTEIVEYSKSPDYNPSVIVNFFDYSFKINKYSLNNKCHNIRGLSI